MKPRSPSRCAPICRLGTVYNTDAPTQGVASLMILALFDRFGVTEPEGFDHVHCLVEATKRAIRARDRAVTDPDHLAHALDRYLDARFLAGEAMKIDRRKAARWPLASGEGDTIWMGAADTSGLVVSYIQSLYWEFGSGCVLPGTGVLMQNRGASFSLQSGALNPLMPGRLPFHTLNPALAVLKDGRIMAYGCMGGDGQPQTQSARVHAPHHVSANHSSTRSTGRAGCSAAPGAPRAPHCASKRASTAISSTGSRTPATKSMCCRTITPTSWATPAPWCCTRTAPAKAPTIRGQMAGRRAYSEPTSTALQARAISDNRH